MFTVELRPGETTIVSWKKLVKDANKVNNGSASAPEQLPNANHALESRIAPVIPCAVLALLIHPSTSHHILNWIFWAFCVYLEAVSVLSQLRVMQNTEIVEPFTAHYVFALGVARFLGCAHWVLQDIDDESSNYESDDDHAESGEEGSLESENEDDNGASNEEEWTSNAKAKSDASDNEDALASAEAALKKVKAAVQKLVPYNVEEFEVYYTVNYLQH